VTDSTYWKVVNAIKQYMEKNNGRRPSLDEIKDIVGLASVSTVAFHIFNAVQLGDLVEEGNPGDSRRYAAPE
jgi:SOS-response transcriptional repressor LexA